MKLSLFGYTLNLVKDESLKEDLPAFLPQGKEEEIYTGYDGEIIPGYQAIERELEVEGDSVEEQEWREEQNWINKRTQRDATI
jgi:hypothetical protein